MRKFPKRISIFALAAVTAIGAVSLAGCDDFMPLTGDYQTGSVVSNGGFVVEKGNYVYFINGVASYTDDNTYGKVEKGALMRIAKSDLIAGKNAAETVVPSLMVAADYTSGLYIYGDRVYFATPNNVKNTSGVIENDYLDFKSAKLDGSDIVSYFRVADNSMNYRYVQAGSDDAVYLMYADGSTLNSYNTESKTNVVLAKNTTSFAFNSQDVTDPAVYYTMGVTGGIDSEDPVDLQYNQIYKVTADTTEGPYEYTFDEKYLENHNGELPYTNLGTLVLDGIGATGVDTMTQFSHDVGENSQPLTSGGYTYALKSYSNNGLYFTRNDITKTSSQGETGWLYYLSQDKLASGWNSVTGNSSASLDAVAKSTTKASEAALFYLDEQGGHHYIYVDGSAIFRADVGENGVATAQRIARNVSGATLKSVDFTSDPVYDYVYFTRSNGSGRSLERAVVNGSEDDYSNLDKNNDYQPVKVLDLQHASDWYQAELIDGYVYFADAESVGSVSYNYISVVSLVRNGKLMTNGEISDWNDRYETVTDYYADLSSDRSELSTLIKAYFYTGTTSYYDDNMKAAADAGKKTDYLYSEEDQNAFAEYVAGKGDAEAFADDRVRSAFILPIGKVSESDREEIDSYWENLLEHYTQPESEELLPVWAWVLIGVGIAVVVAAAVTVPIVLVRRKKKKIDSEPQKRVIEVDTTDDKSVDVYADEEAAPVSDRDSGAEPTEEEADTINDGAGEPADGAAESDGSTDAE